MLTRTLSIALIAAVALVLATTGPLYAIQTQVVHTDSNVSCDPLFIPQDVDEIGDPAFGFPPDESLSHTTTSGQFPVCFTDDPLVPDALVLIKNLTGRDLEEVWYIASNETSISNIDGYANDIGFAAFPIADNETFRIDNIITDPGGAHHPLVGEDMTLDGIWEAGETWEFILQDYFNLAGLAADALISIGVGDASPPPIPGVIASSGSIIAIPQVPEPGSAVLTLLGCVGMTFLSRRRGASRK